MMPWTDWVAAVFYATLLAALLYISAKEVRADNLIPPARYDHAFKGKLTIKYEKNVHKACGSPPFGVVACSFVHSPTRCTITLPQGVSPKFLKALLRHERAHCNGWAENHPR